ncbi:kinase-like protein [Clavulina sp. PMI_390]|nr:kinase-like protein [Clavulina sp. PMI_390]
MIRRGITLFAQVTWSALPQDVRFYLSPLVFPVHVADKCFWPLDRIVRLLGQGTFGKVVEAYDNNTRGLVAVKIIRSIPKYRDASKIEVRVLKTLKQNDPTNKHKCIQLLEWFDFRNHICIVTELLGKCIFDFLRENNFAPFPRLHIQEFARQILTSVAFLHDLHLVHTDLKPENILLVHNDYRITTVPGSLSGSRRNPPSTKMVLLNTEVRLIDFGSATFENEYHSSVVSTRHYRAPEIILNMGWSYPCDAFSLGCILVEFYTGNALFQTHDNLEHLAMMEAVMGPMPAAFARKAAKTKPEYFNTNTNRLDWPPKSKKVTTQSKKEVKAMKALADIIPPADSINLQFQDLVRRLLAFDPAQRLTVRQALAHKFFDERIPQEI